MRKAPIKLRDLRRRIYVKAKAEPEWRFWGLYVHVCKLETLREAICTGQAERRETGDTEGRGQRSACWGYLTIRDRVVRAQADSGAVRG